MAIHGSIRNGLIIKRKLVSKKPKSLAKQFIINMSGCAYLGPVGTDTVSTVK